MVHDVILVAISIAGSLALVRLLPTKWVVGNFMPKTKRGRDKLRKRIKEIE